MDTATLEIYTYDTLFPYTPLFRSRHQRGEQGELAAGRDDDVGGIICRARTTGLTRNDRLAQRRNTGCGSVMGVAVANGLLRSEEHTSELQSLMRISYAVFCLKKKKTTTKQQNK